MSVQETSKINKEMIAAVNAHDMDRYLEFVSNDIVIRSTGSPEPGRGKEAIRREFEAYFATFPDYHVELRNAVVSDDQFAGEVEMTGTHEGPLHMGPGAPPVPPTGKQVRIQGIFVADVEDGKVVEIRQYPNLLGMMMQLGVISPPG